MLRELLIRKSAKTNKDLWHHMLEASRRKGQRETQGSGEGNSRKKVKITYLCQTMSKSLRSLDEATKVDVEVRRSLFIH